MRVTLKAFARLPARRLFAILLATVAGGLAVIPARAARAEPAELAAGSNFVGVYGSRGASALVGYISTSWYRATFGPRAGQALYRLDIASLKGRASTGGGIVLGARSGVATGTLELSHASMSTVAQTVNVDRQGSVYNPVGGGYTDLVSGAASFPARYLDVSATALFINGAVSLVSGTVEPYLGAGLGVSVMNVSSGVVPGIDGGRLSSTGVGIAFQAAAGVRVVPGDAFFAWLEFRPGWHLMTPFEKGAGYDRSRDQFILQFLPVVAGIGWMWQ